MSVSVSFFHSVLSSKSNKVLQNTITNAQSRIKAINNSGLNNSGAEQTEINRVQAATDILSSRGFYDAVRKKTVFGLRTPRNVTGKGGLINQPWFKPAALLFAGFVVFRKLL